MPKAAKSLNETVTEFCMTQPLDEVIAALKHWGQIASIRSKWESSLPKEPGLQGAVGHKMTKTGKPYKKPGPPVGWKAQTKVETVEAKDPNAV